MYIKIIIYIIYIKNSNVNILYMYFLFYSKFIYM